MQIRSALFFICYARLFGHFGRMIFHPPEMCFFSARYAAFWGGVTQFATQFCGTPRFWGWLSHTLHNPNTECKVTLSTIYCSVNEFCNPNWRLLYPEPISHLYKSMLDKNQQIHIDSAFENVRKAINKRLLFRIFFWWCKNASNYTCNIIYNRTWTMPYWVTIFFISKHFRSRKVVIWHTTFLFFRQFFKYCNRVVNINSYQIVIILNDSVLTTWLNYSKIRFRYNNYFTK